MLFEFFFQVNDVQGDIQCFCDVESASSRLRVAALTRQDLRDARSQWIAPQRESNADQFVALLFEQMRDHG